jgi:hypothetical protein
MNFDPTSVVPDYPSAEAEKALDLEKYDSAPVKPTPGPAPSSGGGGMVIKLQEVSRPFAEHAQRIVDNVQRNPERSVALRKLLEAKDATVRATIAK